MNLKTLIFTTTLFLFLTITLSAQKDTTIFTPTPSKKSFLKKEIIPSVLIIGGFSLNKSVFENNLNRDMRNKVGNDYEFQIDDYIQYIPIAEIYIADAMGVKAKNHWFDQTKNLAFSCLFTAIVTHSIKRGMNKRRPSGGPHAFPSGHTATAFLGATSLYHEFKETNTVLAYSGYAFATTTGTFRMLNNAHWFSDVLAGAGISILMTNIVYHIEPLKNWNPLKKSDNVSFVPYFNENEAGIYLTKRF